MDAAQFMSAVRVLFPVKHDSKEERNAWLQSYTSELKGFSSQELEMAAASIKRTRNLNGRQNRFPSLAECLEECRDARRLYAQRKVEAMLPGVADDAHLSDDEKHTRMYGP